MNRKSRAWVIWVAVGVVVGLIVFATSIANAVSEARSHRPRPIPVGTYDSLSPYSTPAKDLLNSDFVFEQEMPTKAGPESGYWSGRITKGTRLTANGQPITIKELEARLAQLPPMGSSATVKKPGEFASLDIQLAPTGP